MSQSIPDRHDSGLPLFRMAATHPNWSYETISVDLITSKMNSAVCEEADGDPIPEMTMKFYDGTDTELVQGGAESDAAYQARLDLNCVKTVLSMRFPYDIDIIEGQVDNPILAAQDCRLWVVVAPHIPENLGGYNRMVTNKNLKLIKWAQFDGKSSLTIWNDDINESNLFEITVKHAVGYKHQFGLGYNYYSE